MSAPGKRVAERAKAGGGGGAAAAAAAPRVSTSTQPTPTTTTKAQPKPRAPSDNTVSKLKQNDARIFGKALRGTPYALIGGFAHQLLGSKRLCSGFDIFIPTGHSAQVCDQLAADSSGMFRKINNSSRTMEFHQGSVVSFVSICEPQRVNQAFPKEGGFVTLFSARVLKPTLLLNMAIHTWMEHHTAGNENWKKTGANLDIIFLVDYIARKEREEVNNATPDFLKAFFAANDNQEPVFSSIGLKRPAVKASGSGSGSTD